MLNAGSWGPDRAHKYLRHLIATARRELGPNVLLYTTDPPNQIEQGTLRGDEVFSCVICCIIACVLGVQAVVTQGG